MIKTNDVNKLSKQYGNRLLITGGAGSGKSLMLRYMFLKVLKNHDQIPVLLFLRNLDYTGLWSNESDFLCDQILKNMQALGFDVSGEVFKRNLSELSYVLFLDGFDEVEYDVRKRLEYLINDFCKQFSNITVVVSSRPESSFVSWNHFVELEIQTLTKYLIKKMIERNDMDLSEKQVEFVSKMVDLYGFNKRVSIKELKDKGFYNEFIDSCYWIIERYDFA
ncbi:MAG: NACHT domain-containing protein, partial [Lachnospiraceae bacterium]